DPTGVLVDVNCNPVLGEGGVIKFGDGDTNIAISADGTISASSGDKGRLALTEFADTRSLVHEGSNYFRGEGGTAALDTRIMQGAIERSNVSGVTELTTMIRVQRVYQSLAGMMQ